MKILYIASEAVPFIKSGGLGDVAGALPSALVEAGAEEAAVILPLYQDIPQEMKDQLTFRKEIWVPLSWRTQYCGIFSAKIGKVTYYLLDNLYYFGRKGLYGYFDDGERFAFFSRAVLEALPHLDFMPDILCCNDWQTGMVPMYLNRFYRTVSEDYRKIRVLFTIHNIQYQGSFSPEITEDVLGLNWGDYAGGTIRYNDSVNFMKTGISASSWVTTVSPTYAQEIQRPEYSWGLDPILREMNNKLSGILNGIDYERYNPAKDPHLFFPYSIRKPENKSKNKEALQKLLGLPQRPNTPVIAIISRLVDHKGMDLIGSVFAQLISENIQLVVLGTGDWQYEELFRRAAMDYPEKVSANICFDSDLAQKIYAGADIFLMPSKSEPCGLSQMIAMRYGTVPVARETGGLKDTVQPFISWEGKGNGFTFANYNAQDMLYVIRQAIQTYQDPELWQTVQKNGMKTDFSWKKPAREYIRIFEKLLG